jgi:hypothetical protein
MLQYRGKKLFSFCKLTFLADGDADDGVLVAAAVGVFMAAQAATVVGVFVAAQADAVVGVFVAAAVAVLIDGVVVTCSVNISTSSSIVSGRTI